MAKIGIITSPATGHINPFLILCKELQKRGHTLVFFNIEDMEDKVVAEGFEFCTVGKGLVPRGAMQSLQVELGQAGGMEAMKIWQKNNSKPIYVLCLSLPKLVAAAKPDFLLVDQSDAVGGSVAEFLNIPYITIVAGNSLHWEAGLPPVFSSWQYEEGPIIEKRNREAMVRIATVFKPNLDILNKFRADWGLEPYQSHQDIFPVSPIAQIAQMPSFFDFPRLEHPRHFHNVGPFRGEFQKEIPFPYEKLNGKPLIYASLGTVVNTRPEVFIKIAEACKDLDAQLVISTGTREVPAFMKDLPGAPLVVPYAPQYDVLKQACLCITHAGMNTVLDALENGVPLVAIPISFDQPGTAARIRYRGLGEIIALGNIHVDKHLKETICKVLEQPAYKQNALAFQARLREMKGVSRAADIIEEGIQTQTTVYSH